MASAWKAPAPDAVPAPTPVPAIDDRHTLSSIADGPYSTHLHLDWSIDWERKLISGSVEHTLAGGDAKGGAKKEVVFDTSYLKIDSVEVDGKSVDGWKVDARRGQLGAALRIPLPAADSKKVKIHYSTTEQCTALGWLTREQTEAKKGPFLYSQCQAIHARSMLPCMDSPARKITYTSTVRSTIPVLMSALPDKSNPSHEDADKEPSKEKTYRFSQPISIPTYLIAIVSGHLSFAELGPRTGIYAEPTMIERAKWEFEEDAEKFLATAEKVVSPYSWTRYDCIVLPPSFPYGGMENSNATTLTPALIAGDRSLTDVLAHELMHSWSGNLVSCGSWRHFWLNEGWTVYLERLLLRTIHGREAERGFSFLIGAKALQDALEQFSSQPKFQRLMPVFEGDQDPDDAFSSIPYEKGSNFLYHLEGVVGGLDVFLPYVKAYFHAFYDRSVTTEEWKAHLYAFYKGNDEVIAKLDKVKWDEWLHGEGLELPEKMVYDTTLAEQAYALADRWNAVITAGSSSTEGEFGAKDIKGWNANQVVVFLEKLHSGPTVPAAVVERLDAAYGFSKATNGEILLRFFEVALEVKTPDARYAKAAAEWVKGQGRMKFCRTIYRALHKVEPELAKKTFLDNKGFYHPIAAAMIEKDLELADAARNARKPIVAVIGSTGTGKSQLAVSLARQLSATASGVSAAEVISADSMQVYKGLDVITNKVTADEMAGIPHHLIDFLPPGEEYGVGDFRRDAERIATELLEKGKLPVIAGGTTYYAQHLLLPGRLLSADDGASRSKDTSAGSAALPAEVQKVLDTLAPSLRTLWDLIERDASTGDLLKPDELDPPSKRALWDLLRAFDPAMAARWHYMDARKVLRSVRVLQTTGKRHSDWLREQDERDAEAGSAEHADSPWRTLIFWVWREPAVLNGSLGERIHKMIDRGLLNEIKELRAIANGRYGPGAKIDYTRGIFQAIGYKEFDPYLAYLEQHPDGEQDKEAQRLFEQGVEQMQVSTRQYAKKQLSWIRNKLAPGVRRLRLSEEQRGVSQYSVEVCLLDVTHGFDDAEKQAASVLQGWLQDGNIPRSSSDHVELAPFFDRADGRPFAGGAGQAALESNEVRRCDICTAAIGADDAASEVWIRSAEWQTHLNSRRHQGALRRQGAGERVRRAKEEGAKRKAEKAARLAAGSTASSDAVFD